MKTRMIAMRLHGLPLALAFLGTVVGVVPAQSGSPIASVTLNPASPGLAVGGSVVLIALLRDRSGALLQGRTVTWSSSNPALAAVTATGVENDSRSGLSAWAIVTGVAVAPSVTIVAAAEGQSGSASLSVTPQVSSVVVTPASVPVIVGARTQLWAAVRDDRGAQFYNARIAWSTSNGAVATVSSNGANGIVTGVAPGSATITASVGSRSAGAAITVGQFLVAARPAQHPAVTAGDFSTCGLRTDGAAWCWGRNDAGQLGDGTRTERHAPVVVARGLERFRSVKPAGTHACALSVGVGLEGVMCWGSNNEGQLGAVTRYPHSETPVLVSVGDLGFSTVGVGSAHACAVSAVGTAYCWGNNGSGQLGNAPPKSGAPVQVSGDLRFASVTAGEAHACGLTNAGAAYCWGSNAFGQLGAATGACRSAAPTVFCSMNPIAVTSPLSFASLSAGHNHTCGVTARGVAYCWGLNTTGQLGTGTLTNSVAPQQVVGPFEFTVVSAGLGHTCGVTTAGGAYCWGANRYGQLGDGTLTSTGTPVAVVGGLVFVSVSAGGYHTCGVTVGGLVYCWGGNSNGQLGNGTASGSATPIQVVGFP